MVKKVFIIFLLTIFARTMYADTEITSLPFTASTRAERYYLTGNLDWPGNPGQRGISVTADSVIIDLDGNTITFGSNDSGAVTAIYVSGDSCTITGGTITHNPTDSLIDLVNVRGIDCGFVNNAIWINNMTISVTGRVPESSLYISSPYDELESMTTDGFNAYTGIQCILATGNGVDFYIEDNVLHNNATQNWRRDAKQIACIQWGSSLSDPPDTSTFNLIANNNELRSSFLSIRFGSGAGSRGLMKARGNKYYGRVRNDGPWCLGCSGGYRYGDANAIDVSVSQGWRIVHDTIHYDTIPILENGVCMNFGQNGVFASHNATHESQTFNNGFWKVLDSSRIVAALGIQGGDHGTAFRPRNGLELFRSRNTTYIGHGDQDINTGNPAHDSLRGQGAHGVWFGYDAGYGNDSAIFVACTLAAYDLSVYETPTGQDCASLRLQGHLATEYLLFDSCTFISDGRFLMAGEGSNDAGGLLIANTSFQPGPNYNSSIAEFKIDGYSQSETKNIVILNPTYGSGIGFDVDEGDPGDADHEITEKVTYTVTVEDAVGDPVEGATVSGVNDFGDTVLAGTTNSLGQFTDTISTNYLANNDPDTSNAQYNPFVFAASLDADSDDSTGVQVDVTNRTITLTLAATEGNPNGSRTRNKVKIDKVIIR